VIDPETYDADLLAELYAAEEAMRSDQHAKDNANLEHLKESAKSIENEREVLEATISARISRRAKAILAWKQSLAGTEDVHAAVAAMVGREAYGASAAAEALPELQEANAETAGTVARDASHYYDAAQDESIENPTDFPVCSEGVDNWDVTEAVRPIIGSAMDVTDEQLAEARRKDEREQLFAGTSYANGHEQ
jgi:hypothetical protein